MPALAVAHGDDADPLGRRWALPFLIILTPSERWSNEPLGALGLAWLVVQQRHYDRIGPKCAQ